MGKTLVRARGTLTASGTIVLDRRVPIQAGEVEVTVQGLAERPAEAQEPKSSLWETLERIWAEQAAEGRVPRTRDEIDAEISAMRDEDEVRQLEIEALQGRLAEERRARQC